MLDNLNGFKIQDIAAVAKSRSAQVVSKERKLILIEVHTAAHLHILKQDIANCVIREINR